LNGVAFSYLAVTVLLTYPALRVFGRLIGLGPWELLRPILPVFLATVLMGVFVAISDWLLRHGSAALRLSMDVTLGAATYLAALILLRISALRDLLEIVRLRGRTLNA
jgi:hypothetical protein